MRDIYKTAESAEINKYYDLETANLCVLLDTLPCAYGNEYTAAWKAIITAFKYGYVMGTRAERAKAKTK